MLALLVVLGLFLLMLFSLATNNTKLALLAMYIGSIGFLAVVILMICYNRVKPLEKQYKDVITYVA